MSLPTRDHLHQITHKQHECYGISSEFLWRSLPKIRPHSVFAPSQVLTKFQIGTSASVLQHVNIGSALSLRSIVQGMSKDPSVLAWVALGSSLSLRSTARFGYALSVLDYVSLSSQLSLRTHCRLGSNVSVVARVQFWAGSGRYRKGPQNSCLSVHVSSRTRQHTRREETFVDKVVYWMLFGAMGSRRIMDELDREIICGIFARWIRYAMIPRSSSATNSRC